MKYLIIILLLLLMPLLPALLNKISAWLGLDERYPTQKPEHDEKVDEARKILELNQNATVEDIREAHKRLIQKNHPDAGGSRYLAAKINEARDILLKNDKRAA